ncbi:MAG: RluA family pseudouridine synthase [Deltaproteobacteria bacterium]|nr:RluA family pseudouridine synthase [Deltaproteobacteria bacterium]
MAITLTVVEAEAGTRLDRFLANHVDGLSTRAAARLAAAGAVLVNGRRSRKGRALHAGDTLQVDERDIDAHSGDFAPEPDPAMNVPILHRDDRTLVAEKPPGIHTAPVRGRDAGTLVSAVLAAAPEMARIEGFHRREVGLVHRLDRDTSGACLFALDQDAFDRLRTASETDLVVKDYHAVVENRFLRGPPVLEAAIPAARSRGRSVYVESVRRLRSKVLAPRRLEDGTRLVRLHVESVDATSRHSLLRVKISRGFRHQVRSVLAAVGHPIVGDELYGRPSKQGLLLHASRIVFPHPDDGRLTRVNSSPERLEAAWNKL